MGAQPIRMDSGAMTNSDCFHVTRFLHLPDDVFAEKGIELLIGFDFHEYVAIMHASPREFRTSPNFRPDRSPIRAGEGYWIVGIDKNSDVAISAAQRLYDLSRSNVAEHLQSLKAFYDTPAIYAHPEDSCICTAPSAKKITGKVAYHGDYWLRKDFRGQGISKLMAGITQSITFAVWAPDFLFGLVLRWSIDKGLVSQYGYAHQEPGGAQTRLVEENISDDAWLIWRTGEELRSDYGRSGPRISGLSVSLARPAST